MFCIVEHRFEEVNGLFAFRQCADQTPDACTKLPLGITRRVCPGEGELLTQAPLLTAWPSPASPGAWRRPGLTWQHGRRAVLLEFHHK